MLWDFHTGAFHALLLFSSEKLKYPLCRPLQGLSISSPRSRELVQQRLSLRHSRLQHYCRLVQHRTFEREIVQWKWNTTVCKKSQGPKKGHL